MEIDSADSNDELSDGEQPLPPRYTEFDDNSDDEAKEAAANSSDDEEEEEMGGKNARTKAATRDRETKGLRQLAEQEALDVEVYGNTSKHKMTRAEKKARFDRYDALFRKDEKDKIEGFTMKEEKVEEKVDDPWLLQMDQMRKSNTADGDAKTEAKAVETMEDDDDEEEKFDVWAIREQILGCMEPGQSVIKALKHLKPPKQAARRNMRQQRRKKKPSVDVANPKAKASALDSKQLAERKEKFDILTKLSHQLLLAGEYNIHQATYERLSWQLKSYKEAQRRKAAALAAKRKKASSEPAPAGAIWEYKWSETDTEVHGPFTKEQMTKWRDGGFFAQSVCRKRGETRWRAAAGVDFATQTSTGITAPPKKKFKF